MKNNVFDDAIFKYGWNVTSIITLWGVQYNIVATAKAYCETDTITQEQKIAYSAFLANQNAEQRSVEVLLESFAEGITEAKSRFCPTTMLFQRDGSCALLCDDKELPDEGVAVCLSPKKMVISQDAYL